jgi:branched-chain amino acid transport system substrate-binding protein
MTQSRVLAVLAGAGMLLAACTSSSGGTSAAGCTNPAGPSASATHGNVASAGNGLAMAADTSRPASAATGATTKIGFQGMLAGDLKNYGQDALNGVKLAISEAGDSFTFGGTTYPLTVDAQDDVDATAAGGQTAAQKLADDKVVAVVGGIFSTASIAGQKIYHDNGLAQISPSATRTNYTDDQLTPISSFRVIGRDDAQGPIGGDWLVKTLGCKNIAVFDDKSTYGAGLAQHAAEQVTKAGGTVVDTEHVTAGAGGDFRSQLTTAKGKNPDGIYYGGYSREAGPLAKQAKELNLNIPIVGGDGWQNSDFSDLAGASGDGDFATNGGPALTTLTAFNTKYKAKFTQDIFQYAPQAYDAANIIINALKKVGPDKAKVLAEIAATKAYVGVSGTISFNSKGDLTTSVFTMWKYDKTCTTACTKFWKPVKPVTTQNPVP